MITKITIEAISIRKAKKDGTPYMWNDKKTNTKKPRTMVSIKVGEDWYMGWSYKDGSAAETLAKGQTVELFITEDNGFKNWRFVKDDDKKDAEIETLKRQLAEAQGTGIPGPVVATETSPKKKAAKKPAKVEEGEADDIPF